MSGGILYGIYDTSSSREDDEKKYSGMVVSTHSFQKARGTAAIGILDGIGLIASAP